MDFVVEKQFAAQPTMSRSLARNGFNWLLAHSQ